MIPHYHTNAFLIPGYGNKAMTKQEASRLVHRFVKCDFGLAPNAEKFTNKRSLKHGGELIGRYLFKGHEWVLWGKVAAAGANPDVSPGYILHTKEYRDGWHKDGSEMKPADDHPTELLRTDNPGDDPDVTIVAPGGKEKPAATAGSPGQHQNIQIGYTPDKTQVALRTNDHTYVWATKIIPQIAEGLRRAADGDQFPEVSLGMVHTVADGSKVALSDKPASTRYGNVKGEASLIIERATWSYVMPKHEARRMADGFEETLQSMAA